MEGGGRRNSSIDILFPTEKRERNMEAMRGSGEYRLSTKSQRYKKSKFVGLFDAIATMITNDLRHGHKKQATCSGVRRH